jgi:hypothetical protein
MFLGWFDEASICSTVDQLICNQQVVGFESDCRIQQTEELTEVRSRETKLLRHCLGIYATSASVADLSWQSG